MTSEFDEIQTPETPSSNSRVFRARGITYLSSAVFVNLFSFWIILVLAPWSFGDVPEPGVAYETYDAREDLSVYTLITVLLFLNYVMWMIPALANAEIDFFYRYYHIGTPIWLIFGTYAYLFFLMCVAIWAPYLINTAGTGDLVFSTSTPLFRKAVFCFLVYTIARAMVVGIGAYERPRVQHKIMGSLC